jgi:hypothetical protein
LELRILRGVIFGSEPKIILSFVNWEGTGFVFYFSLSERERERKGTNKTKSAAN